MRQRTTYPKLFESQIVQECLQPDVSIASVALRHGINANLVRKWIPLYRDLQPVSLPAFVPLKMGGSASVSPAGQARRRSFSTRCKRFRSNSGLP